MFKNLSLTEQPLISNYLTCYLIIYSFIIIGKYESEVESTIL